MSPTETVNPTSTQGTAAGSVPTRRPDIRTGRGLVSIAGTEPTSAATVLAVTACSMVASSFMFADFLARILNATDWSSATTVITTVGGAITYPIKLALGDTILQSGGLTYDVPLYDLFGIFVYAMIAWAVCYPVRLRLRSHAMTA